MKIIILTAYDDPGYLRPLLRLGVAGYILKDEGTEALARAIRTVMQGDTWFSRSLVDKLIRPPTAEPKMRNEINLPPQEQQVLRLIVRGLDNTQIATELHLAEQTVRNYVSHIYAHLGVHSRSEAIRWTHEHNLL
jgi:DNA-binding NarL/FixJ family response regulator